MSFKSLNRVKRAPTGDDFVLILGTKFLPGMEKLTPYAFLFHKTFSEMLISYPSHEHVTMFNVTLSFLGYKLNTVSVYLGHFCCGLKQSVNKKS